LRCITFLPIFSVFLAPGRPPRRRGHQRSSVAIPVLVDIPAGSGWHLRQTPRRGRRAGLVLVLVPQPRTGLLGRVTGSKWDLPRICLRIPQPPLLLLHLSRPGLPSRRRPLMVLEQLGLPPVLLLLRLSQPDMTSHRRLPMVLAQPGLPPRLLLHRLSQPGMTSRRRLSMVLAQPGLLLLRSMFRPRDPGAHFDLSIAGLLLHETSVAGLPLCLTPICPSLGRLLSYGTALFAVPSSPYLRKTHKRCTPSDHSGTLYAAVRCFSDFPN